MLAAPWVCRSCLSRIAKPLSRRQLRFQTTSKYPVVAYVYVFICADCATAARTESVPPALLSRARRVALEHKQLTEKLATGFDTRAAKKLGEYSPIVNALNEWDKANEVSSGIECLQET